MQVNFRERKKVGRRQGVGRRATDYPLSPSRPTDYRLSPSRPTDYSLPTISLILPKLPPRPSVLALTAFILALALRLLNAGSAFVSGQPRFSPLDELYHAKRRAFSAAQFPRVLELDPGRGTHGAWCPWPPLYDLAAGGYAPLP